MPKILQIKEVERVKEQIHKYFSVNEDARFVRRLDVLSLICDGHLVAYVADLFKINKTTVQRLIHRLNQSGFDGLRDQSGRGRKPRLSDYAQIRLTSDLKKSPREIGYDQARWDGKLLSYHLSTHYGVTLKVRRCQNLFKQLGFSLKRPRKIPVGSDPKLKEDFKKNSN
jgi:transposase